MKRSDLYIICVTIMAIACGAFVLVDRISQATYNIALRCNDIEAAKVGVQDKLANIEAAKAAAAMLDKLPKVEIPTQPKAKIPGGAEEQRL